VIPRAHITAWRGSAPWPTDEQVEQDLVLSRAVVELFGNPTVAETMACRGGTALHKLFLVPPRRYSEDIDLVQTNAGPIGSGLEAIRGTLDPWLGEPRRKRGQGRVTLLYRFETTSKPVQQMRLKVEINTREHFTGSRVTSLDVNIAKVIECFDRYMDHGGTPVSRAEFEANLAAKLRSEQFLADIAPLLPTETTYDVAVADAHVREHLIAKLRGDPWKGEVV